MAKKFLIPIDLAKNELQNAVVQVLASDPGSPVEGQIYFNSTDQRLKQYTSGGWLEYGTGAGSGDVSSNTSSSVDGEVAIFNGTTGKSIKRATGTGLAKLNSGVLTTATSGTDYAAATSGTSALRGDGSGGFAAASLNDVASPSADFSMASHKLTNVTDPTNPQDAATKSYVDLATQGINWKAPVRAATTTNGALASAFANGSVIDGVTLSTGDRILIKNQTTASENGIYVVAASGAPSRASDADTGAELAQAAVFVREGTSQADAAFVCSNDGPIVIGTTAITFVQFSSAGGVQAATTSVAGISRYATQAEAEAKSVTNAAVTPSALVSFARKYTNLIGDGSTTAIGVTHGLGSQYVTAQVFDASSGLQVECDVTLTSSTVTTFTFSTAPTTNQYRVVITG